MKYAVILLLFWALFFWVGALFFSIRGFYSVRRGYQWRAMADPSVWFSEALARTVFEESGLKSRKIALRFLLLFIGCCVLLFVVLVMVGSGAPPNSGVIGQLFDFTRFM